MEILHFEEVSGKTGNRSRARVPDLRKANNFCFRGQEYQPPQKRLFQSPSKLS